MNEGCLEAVEKGEADAASNDLINLRLMRKSSRRPDRYRIVDIGDRFEPKPYGVAIKKGDQVLVGLLNEAIESLQATGDIEKALERSMGDKEFLEDILQEFVKGMPEQIEALETAVSGGDGESIAQQAHTMKGASANLGADEMAAIALKLEQMGKESDLKGARRAIDELGKELQRIKDFAAGGIYT